MDRKAVVVTALFLAVVACSPKPASQVESASVSAVAGDRVDCTAPAGPATTADELKAKYGKNLVFGDVGGPEGTQLMGAILYPDDPKRRIDIVWWDEAKTVVSTVRARGEDSRITGPLGIRIGTPLTEVEAANGKPFLISGFGWDYGGYGDFTGGKLSREAAGCHISLRFDNISGNGAVADGIMGEVQVTSDDARVKAYAPVVTEISVGWPLPQGVKPAAQ
ncbi:hypothetical protein ABAC460_20080 [Asticcacaulis sp. AC460]|uniref:hypothetical protein n=1 Tax=Asticcacaulis sp. AC460 TaxID=1282360 RepID=UPI0003C3DD89|nr:hypothetical protein [Asticcacaulis sp. AC460]ESQ87325.1 hypothetical protein ABAC460_20080 [Asticcacaulis sp. AC460]